MKNVSKIILLTIISLVTMETNGQNAEAILTKSVILNSSADDVWGELRQLDKFGELFPNYIADVWIDSYSEPKTGLERKCTAPGQKKGTVSYKETIYEFDDEKRFYSYKVEGIPAKNMINMFKVVDLGYKKSMVIWNSTGWSFIKNPNMSREEFISFMGAALDEAMLVLNKKFN